MTVENYEYTVVSQFETLDVMVGETLNVVLTNCNAKLLYQFPWMAVIETASGAVLGVKWKPVN